MSDLTNSEATDLVRYFLGSGWRAVNVGLTYWVQDDSPGHQPGSIYVGESWRHVFRKAGAPWPARTEFAAVGTSVMLGDEAWATCRSKSAADRTANALNRYQPGKRGT